MVEVYLQTFKARDSFMDFDFDFDASPHRRSGPVPNSDKRSEKSGMTFDAIKLILIDSVLLRGRDRISGTHHEVLVVLVNGINIRISRTNGEDTLQVGALVEGGSTYAMPTLKAFEPKPGLTAAAATVAYETVRAKFPSYEHADCQTFAAYAILELTNASKQDVGIEDIDFM